MTGTQTMYRCGESLRSHSDVLDWDSYDLKQFLPSESYVKPSTGLLTKFRCNNSRGDHEVQRERISLIVNDPEDINPADISFHEKLSSQSDNIAKSQHSIIAKKPDSTFHAKRHGVNGNKGRIARFLSCFCYRTNEYENFTEVCPTLIYKKNPQCNHVEKCVKSETIPSNKVNSISRSTNIVKQYTDLNLKTEELNKNTTVIQEDEIAVEQHSISPRKNACQNDCNESCCSFQHWKEKNFYSLPKRRTFCRFSQSSSENARNFLSLQRPGFNTKRMYKFAYGCQNSESSYWDQSRKQSSEIENSVVNTPFVRPFPDLVLSSNAIAQNASNRGFGLNTMFEEDASDSAVFFNRCTGQANGIFNSDNDFRSSTFSKLELNHLPKGDTALHRACIAGHDLIVRRLVEEGCSVDRQNQYGDTALHEAASRGYSRCVKALIQGRANIGLKNKNLDTAIHLACANSHSGSLRFLLSSYPHSSPRNAQGDTPLHIAVRFGHVTCSRVLISAHCNIDLQNNRGNTALHIATVAQHRKLVRVLLNSGAQAKAILNKKRKSPLDIAKDNDDGETAVMLLSGPRKTTNEKRRGRSSGRSSDHKRSCSEPRKQERRKSTDSKGCFLSSGSRSPVLLMRPKSATLPRKSYVQARAKWRRHERRKIENNSKNEHVFEQQQREVTVNPFVVPQLFSLYRDCDGNVRQQPVVDQLPNPTPEIVNSITTAVTSTKGELIQEMQKTNTLIEKRLDQLENHTDFKVAKLDQITKERINAERMQCLHRIDRRAMLERAVGANEKLMHRSCKIEDDITSPSTTEHLPEKSQTCTNAADCIPHSCNETEWSKPSGADYNVLQPYKTIKIGGRSDLGASWCSVSNSATVKGRKLMSESLNYSDSAYGSLSPRPVLENSIHSKSLFTASTRKNRTCQSLPRSQHNNSTHTLPKGQEKHVLHTFSEEEPEVVTRVTHQFFEDITHAMEDWYERRLQEITAKQQREMDQRVAELERRMMAINSPSSSQNNSSHERSAEDLV